MVPTKERNITIILVYLNEISQLNSPMIMGSAGAHRMTVGTLTKRDRTDTHRHMTTHVMKKRLSLPPSKSLKKSTPKRNIGIRVTAMLRYVRYPLALYTKTASTDTTTSNKQTYTYWSHQYQRSSTSKQEQQDKKKYDNMQFLMVQLLELACWCRKENQPTAQPSER